jgi:hypothetical protein
MKLIFSLVYTNRCLTLIRMCSTHMKASEIQHLGPDALYVRRTRTHRNGVRFVPERYFLSTTSSAALSGSADVRIIAEPLAERRFL